MGEAQGKGGAAEPESITPFLAPLKALQDLLSFFNDQGVIIGGIAASLLGSPRFTADIDAVLLLNVGDLPALLAQAEKVGLKPRIDDPIAFAHKNRVVLLWHEASGIHVDLALGILPFEVEMVGRSNLLDVGPIQLRLPTPEDLIIMKAVAHRPHDLADIQSIAANHPDLDRGRIRFWLEQFGEALEQPDLWASASQFLKYPDR